MQNRKIIIVLLCALLAIVITTTAVCCAVLMKTDGSSIEYSKQVELGKKYYESGDYDSAIVAYKEALEANPDEEEPYYMLAMIYLGRGDLENARSYVLGGCSKFSSQRILMLKDQYFPNDETLDEDVIKKQVSTGVSINDTLAWDFSEMTYQNYINKYGTAYPREDGDYYKLSFSNLKAELCYKTRIDGEYQINIASGMPYSDVKPDYISVLDLSVMFVGMKDGLSFEELNAMRVSYLSVATDEIEKDYCVRFNYMSCSYVIGTDENGNIKTQDAWNRIYPTKTLEENAEAVFDVQIGIVDATTGDTVSGAEVAVSYKEGADVAKFTSEDSGTVHMRLTEGSYSAKIKCSGYIEETIDFSVNSAGNSDISNFVISPIMETGEIRIVLEWGATPSDLDSHLDGRSSDGTDVHNYFGHSQSSNGAGDRVASLDVDDRTGYGPETTTIYDSAGSYVFSVEDYTTSGTMSSSGATVKVYSADGSVQTFDVPQGIENTWYVFSIENGNVVAINSATYNGAY